MRRALFAAAILAVIGSSTVLANAPIHLVDNGPIWRTHSFVTAQTDPVTMDFEIDDIQPGTMIQVYGGGSWTNVTGATTLSGTKLRISSSGSAYVLARPGSGSATIIIEDVT